MGIIDKKEKVLDIILTQHGRDLLSKGQFIPKYYAFSDDEVDYQTPNLSQTSSVNWSPLSLGSKLKLWLLGDQGVTLSGTFVTDWVSQEGNSYHFTQSTAGNMPTTKIISAKQVVFFDAARATELSTVSNVFLSTIFGPTGSTIEMAAAVSVNSLAADSGNGYDTGKLFQTRVQGTSLFWDVNAGGADAGIVSGSFIFASSSNVPDLNYVYRYRFRYDASTFVGTTVGSGVEVTASCGEISNAAVNRNAQCSIGGASFGASGNLSGSMCELIGTSLLTAEERKQVDKWLQRRWGALI